MKLSEDLREFVALLNSTRVNYHEVEPQTQFATHVDHNQLRRV